MCRLWFNRIMWFIFGLLVMALMFMLVGCTVIDYGNFHYRSLGGVAFDKLEAVKDGDDVLVDVTMYRKESVGDVAGKVAEGVARGMKGL